MPNPTESPRLRVIWLLSSPPGGVDPKLTFALTCCRRRLLLRLCRLLYVNEREPLAVPWIAASSFGHHLDTEALVARLFVEGLRSVGDSGCRNPQSKTWQAVITSSCESPVDTGSLVSPMSS